ncbi:MAG: ABC transporter ATP-binding protein [Clostridiaceae bacterium]|nr:ABC transporter ATP-binding protein [Clostridiaceae bacterium]
MKKIFQYIRPYLLRMAFGFSIKFLGTIMDLLIPWVLAYIIDEVIPQKNIEKVLLWGAMMLLFSFLAVAGNIIANAKASGVARDITKTIRHDLFKKICYLSSKQVDTYSVPTLISRMTTDTYNVHHMLGMMQRIGVRAPILLLGGIIVTLTLDPVLTLVMVGVMPLIAAVIYSVSKKGIPLFQQLQIKVDNMVRKVREDISGIRVIKALSQEDFEIDNFTRINTDAALTEKKAGITMASANPTISLLLNFGLVVVVIAGGYRVNSGLTEVGKIIAFLSYFTIILHAMLAVTRIFTVYSRSIASAKRIEEILESEEDLSVLSYPDIGADDKKQKSENPEYHIEFENVSFKYIEGSDEDKEDNISNIDFKLKRGESLGIIGSTGSGKTTIINLLMRFYDAQKGEIRINTRPIKTIDKGELRRMFGVAFQNDILFEDTIMENIRFGRELSEEEIIEASEYAMAKEFIMVRPDSYNSDLSIKGANLSGGQKQRLLISRALAGKPDILILDDSSSALDYKTDAMIRKMLHEKFDMTTKIVVAQRVSTVMSLDHILVLEDGEQIGYGTHEELLKNCEVYEEISRIQMGDNNYAG